MSNVQAQTVTKQEKALTTAQQKALDGFKNTSTKVRYLSALNYTNGQISKMLGIRYQHVRNVLITPVTKAAETFTV